MPKTAEEGFSKLTHRVKGCSSDVNTKLFQRIMSRPAHLGSKRYPGWKAAQSVEEFGTLRHIGALSCYDK